MDLKELLELRISNGKRLADCDLTEAMAEIEQLQRDLATARQEINNFLSYGQGGASFKESQLIDKLYQAEADRDQLRARLQRLTEFIEWIRPYSWHTHSCYGDLCECGFNEYADRVKALDSDGQPLAAPASFVAKISQQQDVPADIQQIVDENFWDLFSEESNHFSAPTETVKAEMDIDKAAELMRQYKHNGVDDWQVCAESGVWYVDSQTLGECFYEWHAIEVAEKYQRQQAGEGQ